MKSFFYWFFALIITIGAAYYQRKTGPTYPKILDVSINNTTYELKLVRSLSINERPEVKLAISDTSVTAKLYFRRFPTNDTYQICDFSFKVYPTQKGFFAEVPKQPAAGKIQYYFEITDSHGTRKLSDKFTTIIVTRNLTTKSLSYFESFHRNPSL